MAGDNINSDKYTSPDYFKDILQGMSEHRIGDAFTPWTLSLLKDAHNKTMVENCIQMFRKMKNCLEWRMTSYTTVLDAQGMYQYFVNQD